MNINTTVAIAILIIGFLFAITGLIFFVKKKGTGENAKLNFLGINAEVGNSSLFIFIAGVGMILFSSMQIQKKAPVSNTGSTAVVSSVSDDSYTIEGYIKIDNVGKRDLTIMLVECPGHTTTTLDQGFFSITYLKSALKPGDDSITLDVLGYGIVKAEKNQRNLSKNFSVEQDTWTIQGVVRVNNLPEKGAKIHIEGHSEYLGVTDNDGHFSITYQKAILKNGNNKDSINVILGTHGTIRVSVNQQDILKNFVKIEPTQFFTIGGHVRVNNVVKPGIPVSLADHPQYGSKTAADGSFSFTYPQTLRNNNDQIRIKINNTDIGYAGYKQPDFYHNIKEH